MDSGTILGVSVILVPLILIGFFVWLYRRSEKSVQMKTVEERVVIQQEQENHYGSLGKIAGFAFILAGIGLGGFSIVPETPDGFPLAGRLVLIVIGVVILFAVNTNNSQAKS